MVADRPRQARRPRTERRESIVERRAVADFAVSARPFGAARGEAGVDFGEQRTASRRWVDRPEREAHPEPGEHPHPRQTRIADLRRADDVEIAYAPRMHRRNREEPSIRKAWVSTCIAWCGQDL